MVAYQRAQGLNSGLVTKFLVAEKDKPCEIYR